MLIIMNIIAHSVTSLSLCERKGENLRDPCSMFPKGDSCRGRFVMKNDVVALVVQRITALLVVTEVTHLTR